MIVLTNLGDRYPKEDILTFTSVVKETKSPFNAASNRTVSIPATTITSLVKIVSPTPSIIKIVLYLPFYQH
ncbi:MAG: hypothetical protein IPP49_09470 [Saprospiraceae bacterium]|nr:hypothetical protein [Saprospiraceae bacterium]